MNPNPNTELTSEALERHIARNAPPTVTIEPLHLSITETFPSGGKRDLHLEEDMDLTVSDNAARLCANGERGHLVIAIGVDGEDSDAIHYRTGPQRDLIDFLRECRDDLALALDAAEKVAKL